MRPHAPRTPRHWPIRPRPGASASRPSSSCLPTTRFSASSRTRARSRCVCSSVARACCSSARARPERGPGAFDGGLRLCTRSGVEQRRRLRSHARNHLSALHAVAGLELDPKHAARHGCRHDEPIAHARHALLPRWSRAAARVRPTRRRRERSSARARRRRGRRRSRAEIRTRRLVSSRATGIIRAS